MSTKDKSNRRDFLRGTAARNAVEAFADGLHKDAATHQSPVREIQPLLQLARPAMAVDFQLFFPLSESVISESGLLALELLESLEQQMTVYRENSEISQLNRKAAYEPMPVEPHLFCLLQLAWEISHRTLGAYDMTSGPLSKLWGFYRREGRMPTPQEISHALYNVGYEKVQLNTQNQTLHFERQGMELNLGGIGKGFALDCLAQQLIESGGRNFLLHGGHSSVLAIGKRDPHFMAASSTITEWWCVGLGHPLRSNERLAEFYLQNQALGTSGSGAQFFHHQGKKYGHLLDPKTGWPADGILSSTVIAPTAAEADALSTAFYVGGLELAEKYCQQFPQVQALLITSNKAGSIDLHPINMPTGSWKRL